MKFHTTINTIYKKSWHGLSLIISHIIVIEFHKQKKRFRLENSTDDTVLAEQSG